MSALAWRKLWTFDEPQVLQAQMALLDRNYLPAYLVSLLISALTAVGIHSVTGSTDIWCWAALQALVGTAATLNRRLLPPPTDPPSTLAYARRVRILSLVAGVFWGTLALFVDPKYPLTLTIVMGMLGGMTAGAMVVYAAAWAMGVAFWLTATLPTVLVMLASPLLVMNLFGLATMVYVVAVATFGYFTAETTRRAIELGFENEGLVMRLRDQTQRALEARQLAEGAQAEAEEANRAKTVFLASVSHDLRQPLHALGLVLGALSRAGLSERQQALLGQAQASALATGDMLATLLDFSKVDAGVIKPHAQPFNLQQMFNRLATEMAPLAEAKGLVFRWRDTTAVMHADPALVELILRNLLLNAIRYTERGGVLLACRRRGGMASIEVWDTGVGIPDDQREAVFREFHQLGNPERDRNKGLGLGLAIVRGLAHAMALQVDLASRLGRGSVFSVRIPLSHDRWWPELDDLPEEPDLQGLRVLLIDDDEHVCAAMRDLLSAWGCWCEVAFNESEAAQRLIHFEPDVVLTDYRLRSHRTGLQALARVRGVLQREVPAAVITGDTGGDLVREAEAMGLTVLHKPVTAPRMQALLLALWHQAQAQGQAAQAPAGPQPPVADGGAAKVA